jgi:hypothetical protein
MARDALGALGARPWTGEAVLRARRYIDGRQPAASTAPEWAHV